MNKIFNFRKKRGSPQFSCRLRSAPVFLEKKTEQILFTHQNLFSVFFHRAFKCMFVFYNPIHALTPFTEQLRSDRQVCGYHGDPNEPMAAASTFLLIFMIKRNLHDDSLKILTELIHLKVAILSPYY